MAPKGQRPSKPPEDSSSEGRLVGPLCLELIVETRPSHRWQDSVPRAALLLLGFAQSDDNAHNVDDHVDLGRLDRAARTTTALLDKLGRRWSR